MGLVAFLGTLGQLWLLLGVRDKALWIQSCHPAPRQMTAAGNATRAPSVAGSSANPEEMLFTTYALWKEHFTLC